MPITVPRGAKPRLAAESPSDTDYMMALATMSDMKGKLPEGLMDPTPFDLRFRGMEPEFLRRLNPKATADIEDRREPDDPIEAFKAMKAARR